MDNNRVGFVQILKTFFSRILGINMTGSQWIVNFTVLWFSAFIFLFFFFIISYMIPGAWRFNFMYEDDLNTILFNIATIYFPYISISFVGVRALNRKNKITNNLPFVYIRFIWLSSVCINLFFIISYLSFILDKDGNPAFIIDKIPLIALFISLAMAGFLADVYSKLK